MAAVLILLETESRRRLLPDVEAVALTLHEESEGLGHLPGLLLQNHGRVLDLHPGAVGRVQLAVQDDRVVDEGREGAHQIQNGDLKYVKKSVSQKSRLLTFRQFPTGREFGERNVYY